jgi:maltose O-acetyltransferase
MGKNTFIDYGVYLRYFRKIRIGNNVEINRGCEFYPSFKFKDSFINIGDNSIIGPNVKFYGAGQDRNTPDLNHTSSSITIGKNVYIGGSAIIRYGVSIGDYAVIGAGVTVSKSVQEGVTVVNQKTRRLN